MAIAPDACVEEARSDGAIRTVFNRNFDRWFSYVTTFPDGLGVDIKERDLIAVTRCVRTKSWTIATFEESTHNVDIKFKAHVDTQASVGVGTMVGWQSAVTVPQHSGPRPLLSSSTAPTSGSAHVSGLEYEYNQCIFLKGIRRDSRIERLIQRIATSIRSGSARSEGLIEDANPSLPIQNPAEGTNEERGYLEQLTDSPEDSVRVL